MVQRKSVLVALLTWLLLWNNSLFAFAGLQPLLGKPGSISEEDWKAAKGQSTGPKDLRVAGGGHYIGGIDRHWWLVLTGAPKNKFAYSFYGTSGVELEGTYEVKEGLVWFHGTLWRGQGFPHRKMDKTKTPSNPIRFALNYQQQKDKVFFNLLQRDDKGQYQYERKWFRPSGKEWLPLEHHKLTFVPKPGTDKQLKFLVKAELTRWDPSGKKPDRHFFEVDAVYNHNQTHWYKAAKQPGWLPYILRPNEGELSAKDLPTSFHLNTNHFGQVNGFVFDEPPKWENQ